MTDVVISYARATEPQAVCVEEALRALGYAVWRDDKIPPHRLYADVIHERVAAAKAVVVIWSAAAARSPWVRSEAEAARAGDKLIQLTIDGAKLPMPFEQIECVDLAGWSGEIDAPAWRRVVGSVAELTGAVGQLAALARAAPEPPDRSVGVLPFANMSGDPEQAYFSDGISEDIITDLSKVSALFVVARTLGQKGKVVDARAVARELGVRHVLTGSVRKADGRVRITAQLIEGGTGAQVWAERYDRELNDIFALQDEISQAIVGALKVQLLPDEKNAIARRGTDNAGAYDLYLMARQEYANGSQGDPRWHETIIRLCERATEIDPGYARAWAFLALGYVAGHYSYDVSTERGLAAAERAMSLDPNLADAHAVRARILSDSGRHDEAAAAIEIALRLEPESSLVNYQAGVVWFTQQRLAEAVRHFEIAALDSSEFIPSQFLISCYAAKGDREASLHAAQTTFERVERTLAEDRNNGFATAVGGDALAVLGQMERSEAWMERALLMEPDNVLVRLNIAGTLAAYTERVDDALDTLAPALERMGPGLISLIRLGSRFEPLRKQPRFAAMMARAEARLGGS